MSHHEEAFLYRSAIITMKPVFRGHLNIRGTCLTWQVSLHHRFLNMGQISDMVLRENPVILGYLVIRMSVPWRQVLLYRQVQFKSFRKPFAQNMWTKLHWIWAKCQCVEQVLVVYHGSMIQWLLQCEVSAEGVCPKQDS